jgi:Ca-activated chloride channel family protein
VIAALPLAALLLAISPFQAEHPEVRAGNQALQGGDPAAALPRYQAAEREAGPHPEIDFDRGNALLGAGRAAEATAAWKRATERGPAPLASRALQNTANALDGAGDRDGAIRALGEALQRDPTNEDARYNVEVLLRRKAEGKGAPKDPGDQGAKRPDGEPKPGAGGKQDRQEAGKQGQRPDPGAGEPKREGQSQDRPEEQPRREAGSGRAGDDKGPDRDGAAGRPEPIGKQDAERLLDALRSRERTMPLGPVGRPSSRKKEAERDW